MRSLHEIQLAKDGDIDQIATMSRDLIEHGLNWRWRGDRIRACLHDEATNVVISRSGRRVNGFGIMEYRQRAHLVLLAVRPKHRRNGLGSRLLKWLEEVAIVGQSNLINLEVRRDNSAAQRFYEQHQYKVIELLPDYYQRGHDALRMQRALTATPSASSLPN